MELGRSFKVHFLAFNTHDDLSLTPPNPHRNRCAGLLLPYPKVLILIEHLAKCKMIEEFPGWKWPEMYWRIKSVYPRTNLFLYKHSGKRWWWCGIHRWCQSLKWDSTELWLLHGTHYTWNDSLRKISTWETGCRKEPYCRSKWSNHCSLNKLLPMFSSETKSH